MQGTSEQISDKKIPEMNIQLPPLSEIKTFELIEKTEDSPPIFELPKIDMRFFETSIKDEKPSIKRKKKPKLSNTTTKSSTSTDLISQEKDQDQLSEVRRSARIKEIRPEKRLKYTDYVLSSGEEDESEPENESEEIIEAGDGTKFRVLSVDSTDFVECLHCYKVIQEKSIQAHLKSRVHTSKK
ncbi:unnamed protein product [Blepharisma stoltei]|uniref:C2H2-type domain-containing protein n=1 Tax=Blepharisma stoltei TaxID=1481888 RepID=A0AAU9ILQ9_9CILI|nr:unnamed protein product [Blepharisma stoltei]